MTVNTSRSGDGLFDAPDTHPDTATAREEISRYYTDQVAEAYAAVTAAEAALARAREHLAGCQRAQADWQEHGVITSTHTEPGEPASRELLAGTVLAIVGHAQDQYMAAARTVLAPALNAPSTAAAMAELAALGRRPHTAALRAAAEAAHQRLEALCRWLIAHGHDLGPMARPTPPARGTGTRRGRRKGVGRA